MISGASMKFGYTILYVDDVEATLSFYEKAFGLKQRMIHKSEDGNAYGELETGETTLAFAARSFVSTHFSIPVQNGALKNDPPPVEFVLVGEDVQAVFDKAIAAGAIPVHDPVTKPWAQIVGYVRDANGFLVLVELCSPVA
jgi:lactoylglutathione lyase